MPFLKTARQAALHALIQSFLTARLNSKLEKLPPDDPKRQELLQQFLPAYWLDSAARRVGQIQAVTHSLKSVHPDAKGTSLYCEPGSLTPVPVVGSHCLGDNFEPDVVGNAAALDVFRFLKLEHEGQSLLELAAAEDADLAHALSGDPAQAKAWMSAFASLSDPRRGQTSTHTLAKQVYWPVGTDVHDDTGYHLLSPLYPSSLTHKVFEMLQDTRFSDETKAAREARKAGQYSEWPVHEYPDLAVRKMGGTKPQNIGQLNAQRVGNNYLLASLPPVWHHAETKPLVQVSLFPSYGRRPGVKAALRDLLAFLKADPARNRATRQRRAALVDTLIDEFLQLRAELRSLPPGWSQQPDCALSDLHARWLDPAGCAQADAEFSRNPPADVAERISADFATWLNSKIGKFLPVGDDEFRAWRKEMLAQIEAEERESCDAD